MDGSIDPVEAAGTTLVDPVPWVELVELLLPVVPEVPVEPEEPVLDPEVPVDAVELTGVLVAVVPSDPVLERLVGVPVAVEDDDVSTGETDADGSVVADGAEVPSGLEVEVEVGAEVTGVDVGSLGLATPSGLPGP